MILWAKDICQHDVAIEFLFERLEQWIERKLLLRRIGKEQAQINGLRILRQHLRRIESVFSTRPSHGAEQNRWRTYDVWLPLSKFDAHASRFVADFENTRCL